MYTINLNDIDGERPATAWKTYLASQQVDLVVCPSDGLLVLERPTQLILDASGPAILKINAILFMILHAYKMAAVYV